MTISDLMNTAVFLAMGVPVVIAQQDPGAGIWSELVKLGSIGIILGWITLVDIPARNKVFAENVAAWREELRHERAAAAAREAAFAAALEKFNSALNKLAESQDELARELRAERESAGQ